MLCEPLGECDGAEPPWLGDMPVGGATPMAVGGGTLMAVGGATEEE